MEENKNLNEMINNEPVLENPIAGMTPVTETVNDTPVVAEMPVVNTMPEAAPVAEMPVVNAMPEAAPVAEMPVVNTMPEAAPVADASVANTTPETVPVADSAVASNTAAPVEEKKKAPVNIVAIIIIVVCCVLGAYIVLSRMKKNEPVPTPTPTPNPVVTQNDDQQNNIDNNQNNQDSSLNDPVSSAEKYTYIAGNVERTIYLKPNYNSFYFLENDECITGQSGTYSDVEGNLTLQSNKYFDCQSCYYSGESNEGLASVVYTFTKDAVSNTLVSADGVQVFTFAGTEEIGNPFNKDGVHSCDNLENAN